MYVKNEVNNVSNVGYSDILLQWVCRSTGSALSALPSFPLTERETQHSHYSH